MLGVGEATSGRASGLRLVALADDRGQQAAANAALGMHGSVLEDHPEIEDLVGAIAARLDDATLRSLNVRLEVDGAAPPQVARQWLAEQGFISAPPPPGPEIATTFDLSGTSFTLGVVGTDEQIVLSEITREALEQAGADVETRPLDVGTAQARDELAAGGIDLYWAYLAPTWVDELGHTLVKDNAEGLFSRVQQEDAANGVLWLPPAAFERGWSIVTTREAADELGISSIAGLDEAPDDSASTLLCSEINDTARGWIDEGYGVEIDSFEVVDDDVEGKVDSGECTFGMMRGSNPWIAALDLVVLRDERHAMPPDRAAISTRPEVAEPHPSLEELIRALGSALTDDTMRTLTRRVVADGEAPTDVARAWLQEAGFVRA